MVRSDPLRVLPVAVWRLHEASKAPWAVTHDTTDTTVKALQLEPPGFQLIQLPWSDDIRNPEADPKFAGATHPVATSTAFSAAEAMIEAMQLDPLNTFSGAWPNPVLQRHYQVCHGGLCDAPGQGASVHRCFADVPARPFRQHRVGFFRSKRSPRTECSFNLKGHGTEAIAQISTTT
jgi:hypothetical protein